MAKPTSVTGTPTRKRPRVLGPRTLWLILKPGTDPEQVREVIEKVTFNGRTVLNQMGGGVAPPTVKFVVDVEKRGGVQIGTEGNGGSTSGDEDAVADAA